MSKGPISHNYDYISACSSRPRYQGRRLSLILRQQPVQARISTSNERDRKPIEPPPIIQIQLDNGSTQETQDFLQNPYFFMSVNLTSSTSNEDISRADNRVLSGQTVSSMYKLKDVSDNDGGFFCFGDLSSRLEGEFRLKFTLFEITANGAVNLMHTFSNAFKVYNSKNMPKLLDATFLSRSFSDQGVRIRIRKEHRVQVTNPRKRKLSTEEESSKSPSQSHSYGNPAPLMPSKRLSLTEPASPIVNSYYTAYDHPEQQHFASRRGHLLEAYPQHQHDCDNKVYQSHQHQSPFSDYMHSPPHQPYDIHSKQTSMVYHPQNIQHYHHSQPPYQQQQQKHRQYPYYQQYPSPTAMLSPPSTQLKLEYRWPSVDDDKMTLPPSPRSSIMSAAGTVNVQSSIAPSYCQHRSSESSIESTSTSMEWECYHTRQSPTTTRLSSSSSSSSSPLSSFNHAIRLPPLHTMISRTGDRDENDVMIGSGNDDKKNDVGEVNAAVAMMQLSRRQSINHHHLGNLDMSQQHQHPHYLHQHQHQYRDHLPSELLDSSRRASACILNRDSYC